MGIGVATLLVFFAFVRRQTAISDEQFLRSMIPHHAGEMLMCERASVHDVEIERLCRSTIASSGKALPEEGVIADWTQRLRPDTLREVLDGSIIRPLIMRRPLIATLLSTTFAFQLLLVGRGAACVTAGTAAAGSSAAHGDVAMARMNMGRPDEGVASGSRDDSQPTDATAHVPCDAPASPAPCYVMAPCAASFIVMSLVSIDEASRVPSRVAAATVLQPTSRLSPPELPPPRA